MSSALIAYVPRIACVGIVVCADNWDYLPALSALRAAGLEASASPLELTDMLRLVKRQHEWAILCPPNVNIIRFDGLEVWYRRPTVAFRLAASPVVALHVDAIPWALATMLANDCSLDDALRYMGSPLDPPDDPARASRAIDYEYVVRDAEEFDAT